MYIVLLALALTYPTYLHLHIHVLYTCTTPPPPRTHTDIHTSYIIHHSGTLIICSLYNVFIFSYYHSFVYMHTQIYAHVNLLFRYAAHSFIFMIVPHFPLHACTCDHMINYFMFTLLLGVFTSKHIAHSCRHMHTPPHTRTHSHACMHPTSHTYIHTHTCSLLTYTYTYTYTYTCMHINKHTRL